MLEGGNRQSMLEWRWDVAGRCEAPVTLERASGWGRSIIGGERSSFGVVLDVPCRRCAACRAASARDWQQRAQKELQAFSQSFFVTLTLAPEVRYRVVVDADRIAGERGVEPLAAWGASGPAHKREDGRQAAFRFLARAFLRRVDAWGKRLRKRHRFRWLAVIEPHADGFPHAHLLVHDTSEFVPPSEAAKVEPLTVDRLRFDWAKHNRGSFTQARPVDLDRGAGAAAGYVTKYMRKEAENGLLSVVSASKHYGDPAGALIVAARRTLRDQARRAADADRRRLEREKAEAAANAQAAVLDALPPALRALFEWSPPEESTEVAPLPDKEFWQWARELARRPYAPDPEREVAVLPHASAQPSPALKQAKARRRRSSARRDPVGVARRRAAARSNASAARAWRTAPVAGGSG